MGFPWGMSKAKVLAISGEEERIRRRLSRLSTTEILDWADQAGSGIARALSDFRRTQDPVALLEAEKGARTLQTVMVYLREREVAS
jgi:hypothetical protein